MNNNPLINMLNFMNGGGTPQQVMQMLVGKNPQANQMFQQIENMTKGKDKREFALQLAKQKGIDVKQVEELARKLGAK